MKTLMLNDFECELLELMFKGMKLLNEDSLKTAELLKDSAAIDAIKAVTEEIEKFRRTIFGGD